MPREDFKPGTLLRRKGRPEVALVFGCTCRGYILWPKTAAGVFDDKHAINVPFGFAHAKYERVETKEAGRE